MAPPSAPRNSARVAMRACGVLPTMAAANADRFAPEIRTMPMPARPCAVAIAAITSLSASIRPAPLWGTAGAAPPGHSALGRLRPADQSRDLPLLRDRQDIVHQPIEH